MIDKIEKRLKELERKFVLCHIPYVGSQREIFISKMSNRDDEYSKRIISEILEYWDLIEEQKNNFQ
jgi:hypothetical protein